MPIGKLDAVAAVATANNIISLSEAKKLVKEARAVVAHSGNPTVTTTAVLKRFDNWAKNKYIGDARVVSSLAKVVKELTDDTKTFTALGIRSNRVSSKGSSRVSSGESSGRRISGGESSISNRVAGSESSGSRRVSGGESTATRPAHRYSGGESSSHRPRHSGGESSSGRSSGGGWGRVSGGER